MDDEPAIELSPQATATRLDDETMVVLHLQEQTYFELNRTGSQIWEHLADEGRASVETLVGVVYDGTDAGVERPAVRDDVEAFVSSMREAGLLKTE